MDAKEIVLKTLNDSKKPLKGGEVAEISGLEKKDVDKAIKQLKAEDRIQSPKNCYYEVKK
jgi:hypothetical protein